MGPVGKVVEVCCRRVAGKTLGKALTRAALIKSLKQMITTQKGKRLAPADDKRNDLKDANFAVSTQAYGLTQLGSPTQHTLPWWVLPILVFCLVVSLGVALFYLRRRQTASAEKNRPAPSSEALGLLGLGLLVLAAAKPDHADTDHTNVEADGASPEDATSTA